MSASIPKPEYNHNNITTIKQTKCFFNESRGFIIQGDMNIEMANRLRSTLDTHKKFNNFLV